MAKKLTKKELSAVKKRAWKTRYKKYGKKGHAATAYGKKAVKKKAKKR